MSPPVRGRGLKLFSVIVIVVPLMSPPVRGRGLKHQILYHGDKFEQVAPRAGAWIETPTSCFDPDVSSVAPRAGAWIETIDCGDWLESGESPPVRGRGLKQL